VDDDHAVEVAVLRWPDDAAVRTLLADAGRPRVLVVAVGTMAPVPADDLEDWLRDPVDQVELLTRTAALRRRALARERARAPWLDGDGLLHHGERWVAVPDAQLPIVALLVASFEQLVRTDDLARAYVQAGGTGNRSSIRTAIMRVRARVAEVGLTLQVAHRRGFVLQAGRAGQPGPAGG
jgi:hypothetical protein